MNVLGTWTSKGLPRPSWSNARGDVSIFIISSNLTKIYFRCCFVRNEFSVISLLSENSSAFEDLM